MCPARVIERVGKRGAPLQGRYIFEYSVHGNGRSDLYLDLIQLEMVLKICGSGIAFSQGVEEGSLGIIATTCLIIKLLFFTLLYAARCLELLEDASL